MKKRNEDTFETNNDVEELKGIMEDFCSEVIVHKDVNYESKTEDFLFAAWIGIVK